MTKKIQLAIGLVLPGVHDVDDACIVRLKDLLAAKEGIDDTHLVESSTDALGEVCVHFDPRRVSFGEVRALTRQAGAELKQRYGHLLLKTEPTYTRRARTISERIENIKGVLEAVATAEGLLRIEFDRELIDESRIRTALMELDIAVTSEPSREQQQPAAVSPEHADHDHEAGHSHGGLFGEYTELLFALACGGVLLCGWLIAVLTHLSPWVSWTFYLIAYFFGGYFTLKEALESILAGRFEIDFLMLVAAAGAAALGEWGEGALLLFLFSIGHALEHYAMGRARRAIEALAELAPKTALVRRDGDLEEIPVEQLQRGDTVVVKPNDRIPADGFVIKGASSVNQAPITGESVPVDKQPVDDPQLAAEHPDQLDPAHRVFAGTINESGALEIVATKLSSESTLARVVEMVNEAETRQSPTQRFTDKFERYFVPAVIGFVVLLLCAGVVIDEPFHTSFYRAMAVLVAASPCALAISTPSAVLSGVARAARGGVLVKGGAPLENLGTLSAIAFDKTGTLTEGKPRLTDVLAAEGVDENELLDLAVAVESLSDHPLAAAVVRDGRERRGDSPATEARDLQSITGRGVKATIDNQSVYIGKDELFSEVEGPPLPNALRSQVEQLESDGRTTMIVRLGERYLGVLGLMDTPRKPARAVIAKLRELGLRRMIMISGDNQQVADAIAQQVGLDEAWGDLMPTDKVESIKKLRQQEDVAMVGDGVNDAPAMANATVGIAMGAAGSEVALETADVALMADNLEHLPFAIGLSRQTSHIIRQNLWFSLGMVAVLVPATVFGLRMGVAVLFHEGSTLLVVFNALRLLAYRDA